MQKISVISLSLTAILSVPLCGEPWKRHTIDSSSEGADGVRLADVNGDGLMDIATGWEEGGVVRVYRNPGPEQARDPWPAVTVGAVDSAEDAVLVDLDGDGSVDVVSACEGKTRTLYVHWAPRARENYWKTDAWTTQAIPAAESNRAWMFILPLQVNGAAGIDLVAGSKGTGAAIGWLKSPGNPLQLTDWKYEEFCSATWIMSLRSIDLDGDDDLDILASNRKEATARVLWLENRGDGSFTERVIGCQAREVMFLDAGDLNGDGKLDVAAAVKRNGFVLMFQGDEGDWTSRDVTFPAETYGTAKGVGIADIDLDGHPDLAGTCESAEGKKSGVFWMRGPDWKEVRDIGGAPGVKFDRIEMLDLDGDGDLDLLTCEERDQLGVIWYENPLR